MVTMAKRLLVVGLGNPGMAGTRHNAGQMLINQLAEAIQARSPLLQKFGVAPIPDDGSFVPDPVVFNKVRRLRSMVFLNEALCPSLILARPRTFMNTSGPVVKRLADRFEWPASTQLCLLVDDLDLPLGIAKVKHGGSARGHNGVRSTISSLQSSDFPRVRVGIGRPENRSEVADYVLSSFSDEEMDVFNTSTFEHTVRALETVYKRHCLPSDPSEDNDEPAVLATALPLPEHSG